MKYSFLIFVSVFNAVANVTPEEVELLSPPRPEPQFVSTVQWVVHDSSPELIRRSQAVLIDEFNQAVMGSPELREIPFEVQTTGNEIFFSASSNADRRNQIQQVITLTIDHVRGKVSSRGRSSFYRTVVLNQPDSEEGYLNIIGQPNRRGIVSVVARAVPMRDLLRELKNRLQGVGLSYVIPGECANRMVDWTLTPNEVPEQTEETVVPFAPKAQMVRVNGVRDAETVMAKLASDLDMGYDRAGSTFIFKGNCPGNPGPAALGRAGIVRTSLVGGPSQQRPPQHMLVPIFPLN